VTCTFESAVLLERAAICGAFLVPFARPPHGTSLAKADPSPQNLIDVPSVMEIHLPEDSSPDLPAHLDTAIRLKTDLIHNMASSSMREWRQHLADFVAALSESGVQETTALLVLLAEVRQELRAFAGLAQSGESDVIQLFDARAGSDSSVQQILARFQEVVATDLRLATGSVTTSDVVRRAMRFIEHHHMQPVTIARVAAHVGRSSTHLSTLFRQHAGTTVHEYLVRVRLRHAMHLLRKGEKIEAVSLLVGYRSKKNFYRHFKTHMGVTPSAYRTASRNQRLKRD
jgi:AraC-like DNA-binding protein